MIDFANGNAKIIEDGGAIFEEGTSALDCVISEELAIYNNLAVGGQILKTPPQRITAHRVQALFISLIRQRATLLL